MDEIKITGEPSARRPLPFIVDRPLLPGDSAHFCGPGTPRGNLALAADLLALPGIESRADRRQHRHGVGRATPWTGPPSASATSSASTSAPACPIVAADYFDDLPSEGDLKWAIGDLLDREINPAVAAHGGFVELIDVKKNNVYLRLGGGCQGCGAADVTLKQGIEKAIRDLAPLVGEILDTTDHAAGRNPYYSPAK